ncbi:MAG TPA: mannonate dehydratase [Bryobacteraceae bacterium]|nr:mannonate dehydratase [Bryobacteraceae bacterium]
MGISEGEKPAGGANAGVARREFAKMAVAGASMLATATRSSAKLLPIPPGIKIATYARNPSKENMLYLKQLGVTWISSADPTRETSTAEGFARIRRQWEAGGFRVYNESTRVGPSGAIINVPEIVLNLPGRDQKIEEYLNYLHYLGKAGIPYMTYGFEGNGNWRSGQATLPRGYSASDCDLRSPNFQGGWDGKVYKEPLSHGRVYSREEIWDNYTYFIRKVAPVAEEAGVRIGIHPDDPPQPMLAGVPRIFSSFEGYKRALEIADSPNVGMCLCVGTWLEGGPMMGKDPVETIRYFGGLKKLFKIHFRNVTRPLPHFTETLMDDGYYDMYKVMKALVDIDFDGIVIPDHIPGLGEPPAGAQRRGETSRGAAQPFQPSPGLAYSIGYMNATLRAALSNKSQLQ